MRIIGCDLHARQQTLAMLDTSTGEVVKTTLKHEGNQDLAAESRVVRLGRGDLLSLADFVVPALDGQRHPTNSGLQFSISVSI